MSAGSEILDALRSDGWHIDVEQQLSGAVLFVRFSKHGWVTTKTQEQCGALGRGLRAALEAELAAGVFGTPAGERP